MSLPSDDLLSAFHDGNHSAGEQATVDRRLTLASAARQELSEIRQISALLKGLPQESLPPEFANQVLARIEREMLVPSLHAERPMPSNGRHRWVIGSAAVLTSAAGLLMLISVLDHPVVTGPSVAMQQPAGRAESFSTGTDLHRTVDAIPESFAAASGATHAMAKNDATLAKRASGAGAAGFNSVAASPAAGGPPNTPSAAIAKSLSFDKEALNDAQIGDTIEALQTEGDQVAVVRLTVVDRQEGLKGLQQLLLAKSRIEVAEATESEKLAEDVASKDLNNKPIAPGEKSALADAPNELLAVLVEANSQQLADAFQELRKSDFVRGFQVEAPIQVAELDDGADRPATPAAEESKDKASDRKALGKGNRDSVSLADALIGATRRATPRRGFPPTTETKKQDRSKVAAKAAPTADETKVAEKTKLAAPVARQFKLQFPAEALPQMQQAPGFRRRNEQTGAAGKSASTVRQLKADATPAADNEGKTGSRALQVLIVVDQAPTDSPSSAAQPQATKPAQTKARTTPNSKSDKPDGGGS